MSVHRVPPVGMNYIVSDGDRHPMITAWIFLPWLFDAQAKYLIREKVQGSFWLPAPIKDTHEQNETYLVFYGLLIRNWRQKLWPSGNDFLDVRKLRSSYRRV